MVVEAEKQSGSKITAELFGSQLRIIKQFSGEIGKLNDLLEKCKGGVLIATATLKIASVLEKVMEEDSGIKEALLRRLVVYPDIQMEPRMTDGSRWLNSNLMIMEWGNNGFDRKPNSLSSFIKGGFRGFRGQPQKQEEANNLKQISLLVGPKVVWVGAYRPLTRGAILAIDEVIRDPGSITPSLRVKILEEIKRREIVKS